MSYPIATSPDRKKGATYPFVGHAGGATSPAAMGAHSTEPRMATSPIPTELSEANMKAFAQTALKINPLALYFKSPLGMLITYSYDFNGRY